MIPRISWSRFAWTVGVVAARAPREGTAAPCAGAFGLRAPVCARTAAREHTTTAADTELITSTWRPRGTECLLPIDILFGLFRLWAERRFRLLVLFHGLPVIRVPVTTSWHFVS